MAGPWPSCERPGLVRSVVRRRPRCSWCRQPGVKRCASTTGCELSPVRPGRQTVANPVHTNGRRGFHSVPCRGGGRPGDTSPGLPSDAYQLSTSGYRRDGSFRVAVVEAQSDVGLRMIDLHAVQPGGRVSSWTAFCDSTRRDWPGRFSRDGTQVAFTSDRDGPGRVYVASRDGSRLRPVTDIDGTSVGRRRGRPMDGPWCSTP